MNKQIPKLSAADLKRFWACVDKSGNCWEWTGGVDRDGYGLFYVRRVKYQAHRLAYFITYGEDPGDKCVCHECDNPRCVRPPHLWLGTKGDNNQDRAEKGRSADTKGSKHPQVKLTERQVKEILTSKETGRILAAKYGVSESIISSIRHGDRWDHLGGDRQKAGMNINNKTGVRGVSFNGDAGRYVVQFSYKKKRYRFGGFDTIAEAEQALIAKRIELGITKEKK